jgi:galactose oxidase
MEAATMKRTVIIAACAMALATLNAPRVATQADPSLVGQWSAVQTWPYRAIHATLLPTGRVMFWDSYELADNPRLWDPATNIVSEIPKAGYNIFCTGFAAMADGRLFMAGGHIADNVGLAYSATFNPFTNVWTRGPNMNAGRWYPTVTNLANDEMLVLSGVRDTSVGMNLLPQVWQPSSGAWRSLTSAQLQLPFYPFAFLAPDGKVFVAGPAQFTRLLDTAGAGKWFSVGNSFYGARNWGSAVMYDTGRVLIAGGSRCAPYDANCSNVTNTAEVIFVGAPSPAWRHVTAMAFPRKQHNLTLLADGYVLATGGSSGALGHDDDRSPVFAAEVWSPWTERWTTLASASVYRGYHSVALLLPDGRVLQAGGNKGGASAEIYSPPYLFKGARPVISAAPTTINYGQTFFVQTAEAASIKDVTMIKLGSVTHSFNMGQRFNRVSFSVVSGGLNVVAPAHGGIAAPGYYMLFILNSTGVPSVSKIVKLGGPAPPPPPILPATPTGLSASAIGSGVINLKWNDTAINESGFRIERCAGASCTNFAQIVSVGANTIAYRDANLTDGVTYRYRVLAWNATGVSGYSNIASAIATN